MLSRKYFLIGILIALLKYTPAQADTNSGNFDKINSAHNSNSSKTTEITTTKATENIAKNATTNKYNGNITTISSTIVSPKEDFENFSVNVRQEQTASRANLSSNEEIIKRTSTLPNITAIDVTTTNMVGAGSSNNADGIPSKPSTEVVTHTDTNKSVTGFIINNSNSSKITEITTTKATENIAKNATTNKYNGNITTISSTSVSPKEEFKNFSVNVRQEQTASRANLSSNEEIIKRTTTLANITAIDVPTTNMVGADSSNNASSEAPLNDNLNDISRASMEISYPTRWTVMLIAAALHYLWNIRSDGYY